MKAGDSFLWRDSEKGEHLWVIASRTDDPSEMVVIVNLTSWYPSKDDTCVLASGDHPFIRKKTCVNYSQARVVKAKDLLKALKMPIIEHRESFKRDVLKRIQRGFLDCVDAPILARQIIENQQK